MMVTRSVTFLTIAAVVLLLGACCRPTPVLKPSKAASIVKKELARTHNDVAYTQVPIGYFECNDNDVRYKLRQLAANELVTYSCERVMKPERVRKSRRVQQGYYYSYYTTEYYYVDDTVATYFVTVGLTDKGKRLVVTELPEVEPDKDEAELRLDQKVDESRYPESSVDYVEFPNDPSYANMESGEAMDDDDAAEEAQLSKGSGVPAGGSTAYERAKARESIELTTVRSHRIRVVKVRNIAMSLDGVPSAKAEVLLEYSDVTPFGRIMNKVVDGKRMLQEDVNFVFYQDKKWTLSEK